MEAEIVRVDRNLLPKNGGLETTVFLAGCRMRCAWCTRPQSLRPTHLVWDKSQCLFCHLCERTCATGALHFTDNQLFFDPDKCNGCHACTEHCPSRSIRLTEDLADPASILEQIKKDLPLYHRGGFVNFSCVNTEEQAAFAIDIMRYCRDNRISTRVETTASVREFTFSSLMALADRVIVDLKHYDNEKHVRFTGISNVGILSNLSLAVTMEKSPTVRLSIVPGINSSENDARCFATLLLQHHIRHVLITGRDVLTNDPYVNIFLSHVEENSEQKTQAAASLPSILRYADVLRSRGLRVDVADPDKNHCLPPHFPPCIPSVPML